MNDSTLNEIRSKLVEKRARIVSQAAEALEDSKQRDRDEPGDSLDQSNAELLVSTDLRLRDREQKLISKIDLALARIEQGDFNECDECGDEIGERRLLARPVTTLCIGCKEAEEAKEARHSSFDD